MAENQTDAALEDLPPSSKFIYKTLDDEGPMTLKALTEETLLSSRTVRYGLDQLDDVGLIDSSPALHDGRQTCYRLAGEACGEDESESSVLVSPEWVEERLSEFEQDDPELRLVEADAEYEDGHIPGAVQVDVLADLVDVDGCGIADKHCFENYVGSRGITEESTVVIYSTDENQYAAYLYWLFKYYRHTDVRLLDGGKRRWTELGGPTTTDRPTVTTQEYTAHSADERIRAYRSDIKSALARDVTIVDVRSPAEYRGEQTQPPNKNLPEARTAGHIPGTAHITWSEVIDEHGQFKDETALAQLFRDREVQPDTETIVYCHVGERSSIVWFVLSELLEYDVVSNYDGSWIEWGNLIDAPVETGEE
ncbi:rhodanese-like domain-containing protein [Natronolimnohabitans sp. A-GB9]|uniref:rhodanese-like domain-containing protein n=1 Tax=Natronolimnohabitans sp. A-GB9 TaxID=3069757 RepID=UPI0027B637C4|nr:rhodanese-like domain-containing protein [Natronolimnohabitans sp. A-GB9]MDQ2052273.1 rhodanese-like domain-containing protein [Natronolimnohabitans sp. A-GB9]